MSVNLVKSITKSCLFHVRYKVQQQIRLESSKTYKAAVLVDKVTEGLSKLEIQSISKVKKLNKDEVRVQVRYCSLNVVDCELFKTNDLKLPFVPGYEFSGEVLEVGKNVSVEDVTVGEEVVVLSLDKFGGFAEEAVVNKSDLWRLPVGVDAKHGAVSVYSQTLAMYAFSKFAPPKADDTMAISIGPGGVGIAALDIASNVYKSKVIAVCDTEDRGSFVRDRGAFAIVTFKPGKVEKEIRKLTNGVGAHIVYDAVGKTYMKDMSASASVNGAIFHLALTETEHIPTPPLNSTLTMLSLKALRNQDIKLYRGLVNDTLEAADQGITNPHYSKEFKLEDINKAVEFVENAECVGKVVVKVEN